jgi:hypothetical protein
MAGERRTESSASRANEQHGDRPKVFVIAGPPNSGKQELAQEVIKRVDHNLMHVDVPESELYALGSLADYRAELFHALQRYFLYGQHYKAGQDILMTHSLLDSFA